MYSTPTQDAQVFVLFLQVYMDIVLYLSEPFQLAHLTVVLAAGCFDHVAMHMVLLCTNGCRSQSNLSQFYITCCTFSIVSPSVIVFFPYLIYW
jgi:hypothetical protein